MGYRGSKSAIFLSDLDNIAVKEQRVNGSIRGFLRVACIRCTLMGLERGYQVKSPSKHINGLVRTYSTCVNHRGGLEQNNTSGTLSLSP